MNKTTVRVVVISSVVALAVIALNNNIPALQKVTKNQGYF